MLRQITRRINGAPEQQQVQDVTKPSMATKRRPLGDISNNLVEESKENASKKPTSALPVLENMSARTAVVAPILAPAPIVEEPYRLSLPRQTEDRPYMQRLSDDIDLHDAANPILCATYVVEMYENFSMLERRNVINATYMTSQPYVNERMRAILVDWLVEVHTKFKMVPETLHLAVNIIDRYLELRQVRRSRLQLVGVSALLIAAKYEEIYAPEFKDLVYITDRAYNKEEILVMESEIVNTLQYNFTVPTVHTFLCRHLKAAHADRSMVQVACYLAERSLQEYATLRFLPSVVAATAVMIARKTLRRHPWSPTLLQYTGYDEPHLVACANEMRSYLSASGNQQQAVLRKYSSTKYGGVAKIEMVI